jgi:hypothetical protein
VGEPVIDLERPRVAHEIFSATLGLYFKRFGLFAALALVVVVPVDLAVYGIGRDELFSGYRHGEPLWLEVTRGFAYNLLLVPLITAVHVRAVERLGRGENPRVREVVRQELRELPAVIVAVLLATLIGILGLIALIIPGIYLFVAWYFVAQVVVVEGRRGPDALRGSRGLVRGRWWRTFWVIVIISAVAIALAQGVLVPLRAAARSADSGPLQLLAAMLSDLVGLSFTALIGAVFYFAWRARAVPDRPAVRPEDPLDLRGFLPPEAPRPS